MKAKILMTSAFSTTLLTIGGCDIVIGRTEDLLNKLQKNSTQMIKEANFKISETHRLAQERVEAAEKRVKEVEERATASRKLSVDELANAFWDLSDEDKNAFTGNVKQEVCKVKKITVPPSN
ncbi:hypothetical protein Q7M76_04310 [Candidatus Liberibacter asiaticus]|uniref:Lipoprotein n=2 Tax=Liberibacter asiaticus TaxID=34021 RepID=C6XGF0_LIBAP|nr:hypothetical protein [Candidatus Liberibacter asiaticus]ACT57453.1 hypothetical protein CLIBASIA_04405 [Candidatus Liberibacter asiaticus str. psy62]AGH17216.1 hypothetical protein WSI_04230 [Candidatus Liberibacter asiaticus str. gxpsy]ALK07515.1 hypothetical protein CD16_04305 [Candidatus Liberibacter asiaticus]ASK53005.1 hypothetical protein B2I23_04370 [Candidatus Liberibacter asiaticus]AWL14331.1 hypothetical protein DIC79_04395 [Candidatus Liberibacter asiaticus]